MLSSAHRFRSLFKFRGVQKVIAMDLTTLREDYEVGELSEATIKQDPLFQFQDWLSEAIARKDIIEPNAMSIATCTKSLSLISFVLLLFTTM
jgi:pyridoxine/pyridoxamine 5'-phosphate oxidase